MADHKTGVILDGKDNTKPAIKSAMGGISDLTGAVKKFAVAAGVAFAAKQVIDFGISSVKAFAESEAAMAKVSAILKTLPADLGVTTDEIAKLASAATKLGFSDETAAENIAFFLQRTNDLTEATKMNNLAMDLARAKNIDLASAANLVGQVMSGNGRVLKQFGIEIDDTLGPMAALEQLQGRVAGQAAAFAETTQGKLMILSESWGDLKEQIGAALAEGLTPFINQLLVFVNDPKTLEMFTTLAHIAGVVLLTAFKTLVAAIQEMKIQWADFQTLLAKIGVFKVISGAIAEIKAQWEDLTGVLSKVFNRLKEIQSAAEAVGRSVGAFFGGGDSKKKGKASGGPVTANTGYVVGENGPEFFKPKVGGDIIPNHALSGGGMTLVINISGNTLLDSFAGEKIAEQIQRAVKSNLRL